MAWAGTPEDQAAAASLVFAYSCVWALGGQLMAEAREPFDDFLRAHLQDVPGLPGEPPGLTSWCGAQIWLHCGRWCCTAEAALLECAAI